MKKPWKDVWIRQVSFDKNILYRNFISLANLVSSIRRFMSFFDFLNFLSKLLLDGFFKFPDICIVTIELAHLHHSFDVRLIRVYLALLTDYRLVKNCLKSNFEVLCILK